MSSNVNFFFSDDDLLHLIQQVEDSEDPVAHLHGLLRALRHTTCGEFPPTIKQSVLVCHKMLERTLADHLIETGWDLENLRPPVVSR